MFIIPQDFKDVFNMFNKHGNSIVFFGRMIPTVRSLISFPAGVAKMNFGLFSLYSIAGSFVWTAVLVLIGYFLGDGWEKAIKWISGYEKVVLFTFAAGLVVYAGYFIYKKFKEKKAD